MATPHAAGAYAVFAAAFPSASVTDIINAMKQTAIAVEEPMSKKHLPALQLGNAFAALKVKFGGQAASAAPAAVNTTDTPAAAPPAPDQSATRFIVDLPGGKARETATSISQSQSTIAKTLGV